VTGEPQGGDVAEKTKKVETGNKRKRHWEMFKEKPVAVLFPFV